MQKVRVRSKKLYFGFVDMEQYILSLLNTQRRIQWKTNTAPKILYSVFKLIPAS